MTSDTPQLDILQRMAAEYRESFSAFVTLNLSALQQHTSTLESLGRELGRMTIVPGPASRELRAARTEVQTLNRTFAAVSKRALRSNTALQNIIAQARAHQATLPAFTAYV